MMMGNDAVAVLDISPVDVWRFTERTDTDAGRTLPRTTVAMDTDSTLGGNSATKWTSN